MVVYWTTSKAKAWKVGHYFWWWWCPSVYTYVRVRTKHTDQRVKPFFKLVLCLVLGCGSLSDSSLVKSVIVKCTNLTVRNIAVKMHFYKLRMFYQVLNLFSNQIEWRQEVALISKRLLSSFFLIDSDLDRLCFTFSKLNLPFSKITLRHLFLSKV